jgi:putative spermidine/putrescine transport system substrate-binding protein
MTSSFNAPISRRSVLKAAAAGATALIAPAIWTPSRAATKRIVVRDDGGIYSQAYAKAFYKPFTEKTGIAVVPVQANAEPTAQIKGMVETGNYTWDMAKISQPAILILTSGDKPYLQKHGLESQPGVADIPPQYMSPYGVGTNVYTTVLAYRNEAFKGKKAPESWADFWNVKDFPGRRSLRKHPFDTLEEAVMGDGVPTDKVYPINLDRAFASLDKIKPKIDVWWNSGAQVEQMLMSGEVDMVATWVSRPQQAMGKGADVSIVWNQNLWGVDNWAILAGTPNADACREFIVYASDPKRQAIQAEFYPAGFTHPGALQYVAPAVAKNSPTNPDNMKNGLQIDARYWLANQAAVIERFNDWVLK